MELVFSDEFNQDGRTFYPGDDPYWEAVDLYYWVTNDLEWCVSPCCCEMYRFTDIYVSSRYDPSAITTQDGVSFKMSTLRVSELICFTETGHHNV